MSHTIATHERISLATTIFSDHNQVKTVGQLSGDDAQNFIDVIDDVSPCTISHSMDEAIDFDSNPHFFN